MIYLMRHGEDDERKIGGWSKELLTKRGVHQVKLAKIFLDQNVTYQVIRSSDIARAKQTAELINEGNHRPIFYTSLLREQNKGDYNGKLKSEVSSHDYHIQVYEQYPNGESLLDLYFRMKELLIKMKDWNQNLLVTHRGVINMFYYLMNDKKPDLYKEEYDVDFASIHQLDLKKKKIERIY